HVIRVLITFLTAMVINDKFSPAVDFIAHPLCRTKYKPNQYLCHLGSLIRLEILNGFTAATLTMTVFDGTLNHDKRRRSGRFRGRNGRSVHRRSLSLELFRLDAGITTEP